MALHILKKFLVSRLKAFAKQFSEEEQEILDALKQLGDYDISAQTVRKIERKYF